MRVLYLNHTSLVSGAEHCLLDLLAALDDVVQPLVACPRGPLFDAVGDLGVGAQPMIGTAGSLRLHPLGTPRALAGLGAAALAARRLATRRQIDLIHANSLRSSLVAAGARRLGGPPFAGFVHDVLPPGASGAMVSRIVRSQASLLFANSSYSADRFGLAPDDPRRRVVYNPVDLESFDPARHSRPAARERLGLAAGDLVLAVVAQITPWKGQREALEIIAELGRTHEHARLLLVGETKFVARATRYDNRTYLAELRRFVADRGLERRVLWLGERADVPEILSAVDILLVPSWEEPFGRIVVEGMAMGCLVAATGCGGPAEIIADGEDGILLAPRAPAAWAARLAELVAKPQAMQAIRRRGPAAAARFDRDRFARAVQAGYEAVTTATRRSSAAQSRP